MDEAIELIAAAQEDDGYIATQITARGKPRFQDPARARSLQHGASAHGRVRSPSSDGQGLAAEGRRSGAATSSAKRWA